MFIIIPITIIVISILVFIATFIKTEEIKPNEQIDKQWILDYQEAYMSALNGGRMIPHEIAVEYSNKMSKLRKNNEKDINMVQ